VPHLQPRRRRPAGAGAAIGGERVFEHIARLAAGPWNRDGQLGLVVGATFPAEIERVREIAPTLPLLIPGVGAQGGDAAATVRAGWRAEGGVTTGPIIVNSSRAVLYASSGDDLRMNPAHRRRSKKLVQRIGGGA
jgi:orotidine-5'-phosphate decarboxylase